jgi:hypothetical protein
MTVLAMRETKPQRKVSFVQKAGDDICGVGAYKE